MKTAAPGFPRPWASPQEEIAQVVAMLAVAILLSLVAWGVL